MSIIKQIYFEDFESLACDISDKFDTVKDDFGDIAIIAKYEEAKEIIAELVCIGYPLVSLDIRQPEWENYCDEFVISLNVDGIWCEPMKRNGEYLTDTSNIIYILDTCSSRTIPYCKGDIVFEISVGECDCDECRDCSCKEETKPTTSTTNHNFYVNGKSVTKEEFDKKYEEFENKYMDNIRDMLLSYCEFMDKMNEWSKRIW